MVTTLRRLFWMAVLGGAGFAGWSMWSSSRQGSTGAVAAGGPTRAAAVDRADTTTRTAVAEPEPAAAPAFAEDASGAVWVAPTDGGACPDGYPIKANDNSGIYHVPGGRFYERMRPERCYRTAEAAEADGYRRSKS